MRKENNVTELAKACIEKYGEDAQIEMIIEELSELILALQKFKRHRNNKEQLSNLVRDVCSEIADVQIVTEQARLIFGSWITDLRISEKVERQFKRIKEQVNG